MELQKRTVELMIKIYCKNNHNVKSKLCADCEKLRNYAFERLDKCKYEDNKPVCRKCSTHCYSPSMKEHIIRVMRYSGPKMIYTHPLHTFGYILRKITK